MPNAPVSGRSERRELRAPREVAPDQPGVGVEVEEAPRALHHLEQALVAPEADTHQKMRLGRSRAHLDRAGIAADRDRPPVDARRDRLDARCRAQRDEPEQRRPVERRPEGELDGVPDALGHGHALSVHRAFDAVWQAADMVVSRTRKSARGSRPAITSARTG